MYLQKTSKVNHLVQRTQQIFHLAKSVETYVEDILRERQESGKRVHAFSHHQQLKVAPP